MSLSLKKYFNLNFFVLALRKKKNQKRSELKLKATKEEQRREEAKREPSRGDNTGYSEAIISIKPRR